jgi:hypothetical protein
MKAKVIGFICVMALALLTVRADAQIFSLFFDENDNGLLNGTTPDPGVLMLDPQSGLIALAYALPSLVGSGDVGVTDGGGPLSDGLRFEDIGGVSFMFFFSLHDFDSIADVGIPNGGFTSFEVAENPVGAFVFLAGGGGNDSYFGISTPDEGTPEPGSLILLGSGCMSLAAFVRRRFLF